MSDHDELITEAENAATRLERLAEWLDENDFPGTAHGARERAAALRAALAAQPQPLFEGTAGRFVTLFDQLRSPFRQDQRIVVYPAVAGSATLTPEEAEHLRRHLTDGHWHDDCRYCLERRRHGGTGVAGSAVPTEQT